MSSYEDFFKIEHWCVPARQLALGPGYQCTTAGTDEQKLPSWTVACVWSSATIKQESCAGWMGEDNLISLQEQDLKRTLSMVIIKAEGKISTSKSCCKL